MIIKRETTAFELGSLLVELLQDELLKSDKTCIGPVILNFRDPSYSSEIGGYRPVEIRIDHCGQIEYITEFTYFGIQPFAELGKSSDFDFSERRFQNEYRAYPITEHGVESYFRLWEQNFCSYIEMGVFDVKISVEENCYV
tara:strand:- start:302 stop:724 length:423 start_codon:yes stop_codon:yes gene_type:complete